jgi:hypothetical protein
MFFSSFYNVGYENLTTIYNHHIENTLNGTNIKCGFDIFLLSYLLFIIANLCCITTTTTTTTTIIIIYF